MRALMILLLLVVVFLAVLIFSWLNPGAITLDLAVGEVTLLKSLAFTIALVLGWLLGIATMLVFIMKLMNDKRLLRKSARDAQTEVNNLRSLPMQDAD